MVWSFVSGLLKSYTIYQTFYILCMNCMLHITFAPGTRLQSSTCTRAHACAWMTWQWLKYSCRHKKVNPIQQLFNFSVRTRCDNFDNILKYLVAFRGSFLFVLKREHHANDPLDTSEPINIKIFLDVYK